MTGIESSQCGCHGRYESLEADFSTVLERIGLTGQVSLPRVNVNKARGGGREIAYREYYTPADRALVAQWYAPEIAHFGYAF